MSPRSRIALIDKEIDALRRRFPIITDRFPAESELFRKRGLAQLERDEAARRVAMRMPKLRLETCPTCGGLTRQKSIMEGKR